MRSSGACGSQIAVTAVAAALATMAAAVVEDEHLARLEQRRHARLDVATCSPFVRAGAELRRPIAWCDAHEGHKEVEEAGLGAIAVPRLRRR